MEALVGIFIFYFSPYFPVVGTFKYQGLVPSIGTARESIVGTMSALKSLKGSRGVNRRLLIRAVMNGGDRLLWE